MGPYSENVTGKTLEAGIGKRFSVPYFLLGQATIKHKYKKKVHCYKALLRMFAANEKVFKLFF